MYNKGSKKKSAPLHEINYNKIYLQSPLKWEVWRKSVYVLAKEIIGMSDAYPSYIKKCRKEHKRVTGFGQIFNFYWFPSHWQFLCSFLVYILDLRHGIQAM